MNEKEQPTPEQLLKMLDLQMETSRKARAGRGESKTSMRVLTLSIILFLLMAALWVLMIMLEQMRPEKPAGENRAPEIEMR